MKIVTANHSSYPRIAPGKEGQALRRACEAWQRGKEDKQFFIDAQDKLIEQIINKQQDLGLDIVNDGQIRWYDPLSHLCQKIEGIKIAGILRYFDTNFYFRQPIITGQLKSREPLIVEEVKFAQSKAKKPLKAVLTGPLTLAFLADNSKSPYQSSPQLAVALSRIIADEIKLLDNLGLSEIQIDEPILAQQKSQAIEAIDCLETICQAKNKTPLRLSSFFGQVKNIYQKLQQTSFEGLAFDLCYEPSLMETIAKEGSQKELALGVVDARNTKLEDIPSLANKLKEVISANQSWQLIPSAGLEYLPTARAEEKLASLIQLKKIILEQ